MVLGETVHSFWIAVQIQEILLCNGWEAGELAVERGIANTLPKEFPTGANANQKLCIGLRVNGQNASPPGPHGEGLRENLQ
jgi:hypothetical protein